ncbi:phage tail tape measure protein [Listeria ilorinensis]|uniref:lytic transglycosylase domain-containing protein n=1 Tax=Listeria ilorinensis TaxID=2867439 RepID=UPI001EF6B570|nr:phage tail tape measure protein [Listeria ilorinensis]
MAGALRKTSIEIGWKINHEELTKADKETDRIVEKAGRMEKEFNQSAKAVDNTTRSIHNQAVAVKKTSANVTDLNRDVKQADSAFDRLGAAGKRSMNQVDDSTNKAKKSVKQLDDQADKTASNMKAKFTAAATVIAGAAATGLGAMFNYASDTNESINKVDVAFKNNADEVKKWSKTTLDNIGLAQGTALDLAATFGDMGTSMGLSTKEAAKMSTSMVDLAGDLASFKNIDIDRAYTALNGVFTGETEALKSLGIVMTQTNLEQFALSSGALKTGQNQLEASKNAIAMEKAEKNLNKAIKEHGKDSLEARDAQVKLQSAQEKANTTAQASLDTLSQGELVQLRYNYVMETTKNSQGDFARTSKEAANATRTFTEGAKELASNFGQKLIPLFTPLINKANDFVKGISDADQTMGKLGDTFGPVLKPAKKLFGEVGDVLQDDVIPAVSSFVENAGPGVIDGMSTAVETFGGVLSTVVVPPIKAISEFVEDNPDSMKRMGKAAAIGISGFAGFKLVTGTINRTTRSIDKMIARLKLIGPATQTSATQATASMTAIDVAADSVGPNVLPTRGGRGKTANLNTRVGRSASKAGLFTKGVKGIGKLGKFGKLAGAVPLLSVALSATELIGMNKDNAGEKAGGFGGSLGGMAGGAAIGTAIAPGIGTAIGGAIGAFAGSELGKSLGKSLQKNWPKWEEKIKTDWKGLSKWAEDHPIAGANVNFLNKAGKAIKKNWDNVHKGAKLAVEEVKGYFADPLKIDVGGKGVSKDSAGKVNSYLEKDQQMMSEFGTFKLTGNGMSEKDFNKSQKGYDSQAGKITKEYDKGQKKTNKNLDIIENAGVVDVDTTQTARNRSQKITDQNKKEVDNNAKELKKINEDMYKDQLTVTNKYEKQINAVKDKASKENRRLTKEEQKEITKLEEQAANERKAIYQKNEPKITELQQKQQKKAVNAMTKSEKEQKMILGKLTDTNEKMTTKQAADTVKSSKKAKDSAIKDANEKYNKVVKAAEEEYYVNGSISKAEYKKIVANAKKQKKDSVKQAEETHEKVVDEAKKQSKGHLKEVDWETGDSLSKWEQFKNSMGEKTDAITTTVGDKWSAFTTGFVNISQNIVNGGINVWEGFKTTIFKLINGAITGINQVLSFFNLGMIPLIGSTQTPPKQEDKLSTEDKKTYHTTSQSGNLAMNYTGSDYAAGQIMAGEEGFEIAYNKDSATARILGANGPEITKVDPGTKILNHSDSKKMVSGGLGMGTVLPGFAKGNTSLVDTAKNVIGGAVDKAKDIASSAFEWISDPIGKATKAFSKRTGLSGQGKSSALANGMIDFTADKAGEWLEKQFSTVSVAGPAGGDAEAWRPVIGQAAKMMQENVSASEVSGIVAQIQRESGGNEKITQSSAVVDVNTLSGNPAKGLLQYIPQTFAAYAMKGHNNIFSGYDQLLAFFNNSTWRSDLPYGKSGWGPRGKRRFAGGGRPNVNETVLVGEEGPELFETDVPGAIRNAGETKNLLRNASNKASINYSPTINITIEGDSSSADESRIRKVVQEILDKQYEKLMREYGGLGGAF